MVELVSEQSMALTHASMERERKSSESSLHDEGDEPQKRPVLPPRPSIAAFSSLASLDKSAYELVETVEESPMPQPLQRTTKSIYLPREKSMLPDEGYLPPKAFHKTHHWLGRDFGYWRQPARHGFVAAVVFLSVFLPCFYSHYGFTELQREPIFEPFAYDCQLSSIWSFVGINLRFGRFSFGQAKAIDLAWNWVVGRGYQGILTFLTFRVFSDALLRCAELTALPFDLYATLALPATKIVLLWELSKNMFRYGNWRVKLIFVWMLLSTIYLIAVPGLMDASTAYESKLITKFSWPDQLAEDAAPLLEFVKKSEKVDSVPICLSFNVEKSQTDFMNLRRWNYKWLILPLNETESLDNWDCARTHKEKNSDALRRWQLGYGLWYFNNTQLNETWWKKFDEDKILALEPRFWSNWSFYPSLEENFRCEVEKDIYQWGFTFGWLFLITVINSVFILGTWILWVDCDTNSQLCRAGRRLGVWRALLDLSEAVREELGPNICAYSDEDLSRVLDKRPPIKYVVTQKREVDFGEGKSRRVGHIGLSSDSHLSGEMGGRRRFRIQWGQEYGRDKG